MSDASEELQQLTTEEACRLINTGEAGFYANRAQSPIPHPSKMCVFAQNAWWLVEEGALILEDHGMAMLPDQTWYRVILISLDEKHPVCAKLLADRASNAGPDLPFPQSVILENLPEVRKPWNYPSPDAFTAETLVAGFLNKNPGCESLLHQFFAMIALRAGARLGTLRSSSVSESYHQALREIYVALGGKLENMY